MNNNIQVKASSRFLRISPMKVRRVLDQIRGRSYKEALMILEFLPYRACTPIWQILTAAASNAENNFSLKKQNLIIETAFADQGPILRRVRPRAKGRGFQIRRPTCHITIIMNTRNY